MIEVVPIYKNKIVNKNLKILIPGSKSYTNRALLLAALAKGKSLIRNPLFSDDTLYMIQALRSLGVKIVKKNKQLFVYGNGGKLIKPAKPLFLGNAGTAVRFLTAALATTSPECVITGNERMLKRPINDLLVALNKLGATIKSNHGHLPLTIKKTLIGGKTTIRGQISSQYLSALLMASPCASKPVTISVKGKLTSKPYAMMTIETMRYFGVTIDNRDFNTFIISPSTYKATNYKATNYLVEGDASSASYFWAIAALNGLTIKVLNIDITSAQADLGFVKILQKLGCKIKTGKHFITVSGPKKLKPLGEIDLNHMPDSAMTVAIIAAFVNGKSVLKGLSNLRVKECDRLKALSTELTKIGISVMETKDSLEIIGKQDSGNSAIIETYDDHRMAMCFAIAGTRIPGIKIKNPSCVSKTYPEFWDDLKKIGIKIITQTDKTKLKRKNKNIVLSGLRGTGKTVIGQKLAKLLKFDFIDTDQFIEHNSGMKIASIVQKYGWDHFRKLEIATAKHLSTRTKTVIATGGGMLINPKNAYQLKKNSIIVLLKCENTIAAKRIAKDFNRPALTAQKNTELELAELWTQRKNSYLQTADYIIDTSGQSANLSDDLTKKANEIIKLIYA